MANLTIIETFSVEQFKAMNNNAPVKIICQVLRDEQGNALKNPDGSFQFHKPEDGMFFFACGTVTGKVRRGNIPTRPVISLVEDEDGERFYLLHNDGGDNVAMVW